MELILSDLEVLERRIEKTVKLARSGDKKAKEELELMEKIKAHLESGKPVRTLDCSEEESEIIKGLFLLTSKPVLYAANISEEDLTSGEDNNFVKLVKDFAFNENSEVITICAKLKKNYLLLKKMKNLNY